MPEVTGGAVHAIAAATLAAAAMLTPAPLAHTATPKPPAAGVRAAVVTPDATAIEYLLHPVQPGSTTAVR